MQLGKCMTEFSDDIFMSSSSMQTKWESLTNLISRLNLGEEKPIQNATSEIEQILSIYFGNHTNEKNDTETKINLSEQLRDKLTHCVIILKDQIYASLPEDNFAHISFQIGQKIVTFFDTLYMDVEIELSSIGLIGLENLINQITDLRQNKKLQDILQFYHKVFIKYNKDDHITGDDKNSILKTENELNSILFG